MSSQITFVVFILWLFIGKLLFDKLLKIKTGCLATIVLLFMAMICTSATQKGIDWYGEWQEIQEQQTKEERLKEARYAVLSFLQEMNPLLSKKLMAIQEEVTRIDSKIKRLDDLKQEFPKHVIIDDTLNQWLTLRQQLSQVSQNIFEQVKQAYIAYQIKEIQGQDKFSVLSEELLKEANTALANAEITTSTIEAQLNNE
ncbi:membrane protein [Beggiatoa sp. PS]|nr:membrane protein [Beggiatoa sp. PS]